MRTVFKDPELQAQFAHQGYLKLPFCPPAQLQEWATAIFELHPDDRFQARQKTGIQTQTYHCTFFDSNQEYRTKVFELLKRFFTPVADTHLQDYKFAQANLFLKPPQTGYVYPHQNLTIVDESQYTSVSLWCPLIDTDAGNGTMHLIPGSHRYFMKYRNTNILWPLSDFFRTRGKDYCQAISVKAGELLIIDDRIIHYTPINQSSENRPVFHAMLAPEEAGILYLEREGKQLKIFEVEDLFWQHYLPGTILADRDPDRVIDYEETLYSDQQLIDFFEELKMKMVH